VGGEDDGCWWSIFDEKEKYCIATTTAHTEYTWVAQYLLRYALLHCTV
jgi:hypothetical protein